MYVGASLNDQDILAAIDRWVTDDVSQQGSFSAGECELLAYAGGFMTGLDPVLQEADAHGQTMFFSSGDTGSQCPAVVGVNGVPVGIPGVNYPASSPYGIGVGGTSVLSPSGPAEIAWYAGGGGSSFLEPTPAFQSSTTIGGVAALVRRGVPDVSLDADPESGYDVVVNGSVVVVGGTSASAPSWQGIWARAQGGHGGSLGFAGLVMYKTEPASAFHDITLGAMASPPYRAGTTPPAAGPRTSRNSSAAPERVRRSRAAVLWPGSAWAGGLCLQSHCGFRRCDVKAKALLEVQPDDLAGV